MRQYRLRYLSYKQSQQVSLYACARDLINSMCHMISYVCCKSSDHIHSFDHKAEPARNSLFSQHPAAFSILLIDQQPPLDAPEHRPGQDRDQQRYKAIIKEYKFWGPETTLLYKADVLEPLILYLRTPVNGGQEINIRTLDLLKICLCLIHLPHCKLDRSQRCRDV